MKTLNLTDQFKKLQQRKDLLMIFILLFVIIIFWIMINVFSSQQKSGISGSQRQMAQSLSPNLDVSVIEELEGKIIYSEAELAEFPVFIVGADQSSVSTATEVSGTEETSGQDQQIILPSELQGALDELEEGL